MNNTLVSIILPTHNGEQFIGKSIDSCLSQTHKNIELIIIDDCSDDSTSDIIKSFIGIDHRVKVITKKTKGNLPMALNKGHANANGEYITWTSDDNAYNRDAIEIMVFEIIKYNADLVYSDFSLIDSESNIIKEHSVKNPAYIIYGNPVGPSFLYKREVYSSSSGYPEKLPLVEDYYFFLHASKSFLFHKISKSLYNYRVHDQSLTSKIITDSNTYQSWKYNLERVYLSYFQNIDNAELNLLIRINQTFFDCIKKENLSYEKDIITFLKLIKRIHSSSPLNHNNELFYQYSTYIYKKIIARKKQFPIAEIILILLNIFIFIKVTNNSTRKKILKYYLKN